MHPFRNILALGNIGRLVWFVFWRCAGNCHFTKIFSNAYFLAKHRFLKGIDLPRCRARCATFTTGQPRKVQVRTPPENSHIHWKIMIGTQKNPFEMVPFLGTFLLIFRGVPENFQCNTGPIFFKTKIPWKIQVIDLSWRCNEKWTWIVINYTASQHFSVERVELESYNLQT